MKALCVVFMIILIFSCQKTETRKLNQVDCSDRVIGDMLGVQPVGFWKYYDEKRNLILKIDYQVGIVDTFHIESLIKYFSGNGRLIHVEGNVGDSIVNIYSDNEIMIKREAVGKLLVEEYCYACHKMDTRHIAKKLREYDFSQIKFKDVLRDRNHSLEEGNFIWENKRNLLFVDEDQLASIGKYINTSPVVSHQ
jgi:hypothetical protein